MNYVQPESKHAKCAYRALTLSGISFFAAILNTLFLPFILSPIALIFSHLSKGRLKSKHIAAQAATVISILALIVNIVMIGFNFYRFQYDESFKNELNEASQALYGISFEQYEKDLLSSLGLEYENE